MKKPNKMTFFLFYLIRLASFASIAILIMIGIEAFIILFEPDPKLSESFLLFCLSFLFWADIMVFKYCKGDLFSEKYENSTTQWVFQIMYILDYILGGVLVVMSVVNLIKYFVC